MVVTEKAMEKGFSLIETAIILGIIGLMVASVLETYNLSAKSRHITDTGYRAEAIQSALDKFMTANDRLPCPADPKLTDTTGAGYEDCSTGLALNTCNANGFCRVSGYRDTDADADTSNDPVYIGAIPYATLNLPAEDAVDGWGGKFLYAISQYMTDKNTYKSSRGVINVKIKDKDLGIIPQTRKVNGIDTPFAIPFVVMSSGENNVGAYNAQGRILAACSGADNGYDLQNCDNNAEFYDFAPEYRSYVPGSDYYDDRVVATFNNMRTDRWGYSELATNDIFNTATARVGIGTDVPSEMLDVAGSLRAQNVIGNNFCNGAGTNCFPPGMIAGTGVNCMGGIVTGVKSANVTCAAQVSVSGITPSTCTAGHYVTGFDSSGNIQCSP